MTRSLMQPTRPSVEGTGHFARELALPRHVLRLSSALAVLALAGGVSTFAFGGVLHATPVINGSARDTGLVMFAVGVPALLLAMLATARGSARALFVWFGSTM